MTRIIQAHAMLANRPGTRVAAREEICRISRNPIHDMTFREGRDISGRQENWAVCARKWSVAEKPGLWLTIGNRRAALMRSGDESLSEEKRAEIVLNSVDAKRRIVPAAIELKKLGRVVKMEGYEIVLALKATYKVLDLILSERHLHTPVRGKMDIDNEDGLVINFHQAAPIAETFRRSTGLELDLLPLDVASLLAIRYRDYYYEREIGRFAAGDEDRIRNVRCSRFPDTAIVLGRKM